MIPMACPDCGRRGVVPPDRILSRLHCKNCGSLFHVDASGRVIRGDVVAPDTPGHAAAEHATHHTHAEPDPLVIWDRLVIAGKLVVAVALFGAIFLIAGVVDLPWKGLSPNLEDRGKFVCKAFLDKDLEALRRIAMPGTEDDLKQWYMQLRDRYQAPPGNLMTFVTVMDASSGSANMLVSMMGTQSQLNTAAEARPHCPAGPQPCGTFDLPLLWTQAPGGRWLLDGTKTLHTTNEVHSTKRLQAAHTAAL